MYKVKLSASIAAALCLITSLVHADNDYMVEKGDSLSKIGKLFGIPYQEIMKVNKLTTTVIHPDQILKIPSAGKTTDSDLAAAAHAAEVKAATEKQMAEVPVSQEPLYPGYADLPTENDAAITQTAYIPPVQGASKTRAGEPNIQDTYIVRAGDTVWSISRRFGVGEDELKQVNKIKFASIQIGQVLTLPAPVSIAAASR